MFASNALIGLREGLEAALVVVILLAFLAKTERGWAARYVWLGVGAAVALSVALGALLTYGTRQLTFEAQELIGGTASIIAVGFVTAMVFWMKGAARTISGELKGRLDRALDLGPLAIALVGFLGVGREGLETAGRRAGIPVVAQGPGPMVHLAFPRHEAVGRPSAYRDLFAFDAELGAAFVRGMQDRGVRLLARGLWYVSAAHTQEDVDRAVALAGEVMRELAGPRAAGTR